MNKNTAPLTVFPEVVFFTSHQSRRRRRHRHHHHHRDHDKHFLCVLCFVLCICAGFVIGIRALQRVRLETGTVLN